MKKDNVNLFFSCDDRYVPYLAVTLASIKSNCDTSRIYDIRILHTGICDSYIEKIKSCYADKCFNIEFYNIQNTVERISEKLHTRDYYSKTTYYRLFIPTLFPNIKKALYLDVDLAVVGNIAELYDTDIGENLVGAIPDGFVKSVDILADYVVHRVGVERPEDYFNAGVLLMNLERMREIGFEDIFIELIQSVKFDIAQDQDYLNLICRGRCARIGYEWNCMPSFCHNTLPEKLIHYNLDDKPWRKDDVPYADVFWHYARKTPFISEIKCEYNSYSPEMKAKIKADTEKLCLKATEEANDTSENERIRETASKILRKAKETSKTYT